jgi:transposase
VIFNRVPGAGATSSRRRPCLCGCEDRARRYPSDLTDGQWAVLEQLLPAMLCDTPLGGRPERHARRAVIDALFYVLDSGCKWRSLPADFPPWKTVHALFARWAADGVWAWVAARLLALARVLAGRDPEPSAGVIDAQSVARSAEGVAARATSGFDPHKKVNGRKRHLLVDTDGLLIAAAVTPASAADRAGAALALKAARAAGRDRLRLAWADRAYHGDWRHWAARELGVTINIVEQPPGQKGFQVLPRRWVIERTHAWITRRRRCARDYERLPDTHQAWIHLAAIFQMNRRVAKPPADNPTQGLRTASIVGFSSKIFSNLPSDVPGASRVTRVT